MNQDTPQNQIQLIGTAIDSTDQTWYAYRSEDCSCWFFYNSSQMGSFYAAGNDFIRNELTNDFVFYEPNGSSHKFPREEIERLIDILEVAPFDPQNPPDFWNEETVERVLRENHDLRVLLARSQAICETLKFEVASQQHKLAEMSAELNISELSS